MQCMTAISRHAPPSGLLRSAPLPLVTPSIHFAFGRLCVWLLSESSGLGSCAAPPPVRQLLCLFYLPEALGVGYFLLISFWFFAHPTILLCMVTIFAARLVDRERSCLAGGSWNRFLTHRCPATLSDTTEAPSDLCSSSQHSWSHLCCACRSSPLQCAGRPPGSHSHRFLRSPATEVKY